MLHPLLRRQLQSFFGNETPEEYIVFFETISHTYDQLENEQRSAELLQAKLRTLLENSDTAYVLLDTELKILSFNRLAAELAVQNGGVIREGESYLDVMAQHRREDVLARLQSVLEKKEPLSYEVNYEHAGSRNKWLHIRIFPIFGEKKEILGLSVAATNVTEQRNAEQQLRESNERYELVTKATNDVIWDWDIASDTIYRSENYKEVFGYPAQGTDTRTWLQRVHPEDRERISESMRQMLSNPGSQFWEEEYRYFRNSGEVAHVQDRAYMLYGADKKPVRMVGAMRDVTREKVIALERDKMNEEVMQRNRDLEQFAYIISHNLRAPVANILGLSGILEKPGLSEEDHKKCLNGLAVSVKKLDDIILDLNYILQVRREVNERKETVRFSTIVSDIKTSIDNLLQQENVQIITDFSAADEFFTLKSYLNSIFYNLMLNSIKYRRPGVDPILRISSRKEGGRLLLSFSDNGLGIDMNSHGHKLFGLYKRFHSHADGKGMGLYMVKTQVEILGGKISVSSELNKGTEFLIELGE